MDESDSYSGAVKHNLLVNRDQLDDDEQVRSVLVQNSESFAECEPEELSRVTFCSHPLSVKLILSNELCERFCYFGYRTILTAYLSLHWNDAEVTSISSYFSALSCVIPLFCGHLSDAYLGRYYTIIIFSLVYFLGALTLTQGTWDAVNPSQSQWFVFLALSLTSLGTGGIKPCVSTFGADQLNNQRIRNVPADQLTPVERHSVAISQSFFYLFYFVINIGSILATALIPILRTNVSYTVAFAVPAGALLLSVLLIWSGQMFGMYQHKQPDRNGSALYKVYSLAKLIYQRKQCVKRHFGNDHYKAEQYLEEWYQDNKLSPSDAKCMGCNNGEQVKSELTARATSAAAMDAILPVNYSSCCGSSCEGCECGCDCGDKTKKALVKDSRSDNTDVHSQMNAKLFGEELISSNFCPSLDWGMLYYAPLDALRNKETLTGEELMQHVEDIQNGLSPAPYSHGFSCADIAGFRKIISVLPVLGVLPVFWCLMNQQGSTWILQAQEMDNKLWGYHIDPEQLSLLNPAFLFILLPLFEWLFRRINPAPISKMVVGMFCAGVAYVCATCVDWALTHQKVHLLWQTPQFFFVTLAEVLVSVTSMHLAFSAAPHDMKSLMTALFLFSSAIGDIITGGLYNTFEAMKMERWMMFAAFGVLVMINGFVLFLCRHKFGKLLA